MEKKRTMKKRWVLDQAVRHTIEETWAVFTNGAITPNPALFLTRLADLARSNAFLFNQAVADSVAAQERSVQYTQRFFTEGMEMLKANQQGARSLMAAQERTM